MAAFQILLFLAIVAVPVWLLATRNGPALLVWVLAVICLDVFNAKGGVNISAASITGLLLAPYSARLLFAFRRSPIAAWAAAHFGYLVILGVVFGFVFPWADTVGRPLNLQAEGRTVLYLMRETAALSLAVFVGQQVAKAGQPDRVLGGILIAALVTSAVAVLEYVTGISYFLLFNEGVIQPTYWNLRVRGLNFEPRGLGLVGAHAMVVGVLFLAARRLIPLSVIALTAIGAAMLLGASTSGLVAGAAGISVVFVSHQRVRRYLFRAAIAVLLIGGAVAALQWDRISALQLLLGQRIGSTVRYGTATNWFEEIVFRMEVFDTSAAMFLAANPWYLLVGTGPGLVSIPATPFMPVTPYTSMYVAPGLNSPPTMGVWLELANGGLVALMLWAGSVLAGGQSLTWIATHDEAHRRSWTVARWSFAGAATIYLLAAGFLSSLWPLFLGVAMGSAFIRHGRAVEPAAVPAT